MVVLITTENEIDFLQDTENTARQVPVPFHETKTRHFTNSRPVLFPTITAYPFLYSVPLLPQFLHCRRRTIETGKPFTLLPENGWGRKKSFS